MNTSPYAGQPAGPAWLATTQQLVAAHPLSLTELRETCLVTWDRLWRTTVGDPPLSVKLTELDVPATIVGYFFEVLLARELASRHPKVWRGNQSKDEKDLVCLTDSGKSFEIKSSGQLGYKVYGNRSHGQKAANELLVKKEKSGYYVTINFWDRTLTLIRFGWLDDGDWDPQEAPTGQMAGLRPEVYQYKLIPVSGPYRRNGPVRLLHGVGEKTQVELAGLGIDTIGDLIDKQKKLSGRMARILADNQEFLDGCDDSPNR